MTSVAVSTISRSHSLGISLPSARPSRVPTPLSFPKHLTVRHPSLKIPLVGVMYICRWQPNSQKDDTATNPTTSSVHRSSIKTWAWIITRPNPSFSPNIIHPNTLRLFSTNQRSNLDDDSGDMYTRTHS